MSTRLARIIDQFPSKRVLVIGDAMLDSYVIGTSTRLSQEAPVPVIAVQERIEQLQYRLTDLLTDAPRPTVLRDAVARADVPVLLIAAGRVADEGHAAAWIAAGAENGPMGYPNTDTLCGRVAGGCTQQLYDGYYAWSPATGAHTMDHQVHRVWQLHGGEAGAFGYPTADSYMVSSNLAYAEFQGGEMYVSCRDPQQPCTHQVAFDS